MIGELKASWSGGGRGGRREGTEEVEEREASGFLEASIPPPSFPTYLWTILPYSSSYLVCKRSLG